ncbi:MAG: caspase family protein [Marmoricola sp.]
MTSTASTARKVGLSRDQLVAMHPYVIDIPDGKLAEGSSTLPTSVSDFKTTRADVDAIFETYLPSYIAGRDGEVPLVVWAHGGLVSKESGLGIANHQVEWWKQNGAFPVQFVWETGLADSLWDAVKDSLPGRSRGFLDEAFDKAIEEIVRHVPGAIATWGAMKTTALLASEKEKGGAWYFATRLGEFMKANPGAITVHAVGHSAGSIFHSHLIPEMLDAGVPTISSLDLLAPAVRVAEFKDRLMRKPVLDKIEKLAMFTMSESFEKKDTCIGIYGKSLLYLIRASLEKEQRAEILGLQECVRRDDDLTKLFGSPGSGSQGEVMWSKTVGGGPFSSTTSTSHGGFDNNPATMNSLARRILGDEHLPLEWGDPSGPRGLDDMLWRTEDEAFEYINTRGAAAGPAGREGRKRALCIGIDSYPGKYRLQGCVADAELWKATFEKAGFAVDLLTDKSATRERMVERIKELIVSSRPGDVLALQYAGHGTTVEDFNHDELPEFQGDSALVDEAICPVDFNSGNLLIDDDLGEIWDLLPEGVSLTMFFDSCHSGGSQRDLTLEVPTAKDARARMAVLSPRAVAAYRRKRGTRRVRPAVGDNERGVFFGACKPDELAWERDGHGDFTRLAVPLLPQALAGASNEAFLDRVLAAFGAKRKQTPVLLPPHLTSRRLLGSAVPDRAVVIGEQVVHALPDPPPALPPGPVTARDRAVAKVLRGVADLVES